MNEIPEEKYRNGGLTRVVMQHDQDLYRGDKDNPGLTIRMATMEDRVDRTNDNMKWIVRLAVGSLFTAVGTITTAIILMFIKVH